jgi:hypothetical protein
MISRAIVPQGRRDSGCRRRLTPRGCSAVDLSLRRSGRLTNVTTHPSSSRSRLRFASSFGLLDPSLSHRCTWPTVRRGAQHAKTTHAARQRRPTSGAERCEKTLARQGLAGSIRTDPATSRARADEKAATSGMMGANSPISRPVVTTVAGRLGRLASLALPIKVRCVRYMREATHCRCTTVSRSGTPHTSVSSASKVERSGENWPTRVASRNWHTQRA